MADNAATPAPEPAAESKVAPPWGEDFDAERAWTLVQNLRAERDGLKAKVSTLEAERQAREDEGKSAEQKAADALAAAQKKAADAERSLFVERAVRKFGLSDELAEFLTGETEEEIVAKAERLSKIGKPSEPSTEEPAPGSGDAAPTSEDTVPGKPKPDLTPGHGGDNVSAFDPVDLAKRVRG